MTGIRQVDARQFELVENKNWFTNTNREYGIWSYFFKKIGNLSLWRLKRNGVLDEIKEIVSSTYYECNQ